MVKTDEDILKEIDEQYNKFVGSYWSNEKIKRELEYDIGFAKLEIKKSEQQIESLQKGIRKDKLKIDYLGNRVSKLD